MRLTKEEALRVIELLERAAKQANAFGGTYQFDMQEYRNAAELVRAKLGAG